MKIQWTEVTELGIQGRGWSEGAHPYDRLPERAEEVVTEAVWNLSRQSAGMWVDFVSDATLIQARIILRRPPFEHHSYIKYLDLYCRNPEGQWRWAGVSRSGFVPSGRTYLIDGLPPREREWRLYLPLTYEVERLELGIPEEASLAPAPPDPRKPIVLYGTSIVHGCGHLSRPGMAWPSIMARKLNWPLINLGFSGSARMEPPLGKIIAELDPVVFAVDPLANMTAELVEENARPFLRTLLQAHPKTPLLLIDNRDHADAWLHPAYAVSQEAKRTAFRAIANELQAEGFEVGWVDGKHLIGLDGEGTTDASHPSDLGAMRYAEIVTPAMAKLLPGG